MPDSKLDSLLARLADETITAEEFQRLERQLQSNPEAQRRYLHYLDLHADLHAVDLKSLAAPGNRHRAAALIAAAALIVLALLLHLQNAPAPPVLLVVDSDGPVRWIGTGAASEATIARGDELAMGTLETTSADSWVELTFQDQTSITMAGRSMLTVAIVDRQKILRLEKGNVSINAAKQPLDRPLQVITPSAKAEVLGTQFNIRATAYSTRIVVNEGRVRVTRLADGRVEEVDANEFLVAAVENTSDFTASPRPTYAVSWKSDLPRGLLRGQWEPGKESMRPGVRAVPHIWRGEPDNQRPPILLYTVLLDPSPRRQPPFRIMEGSRLHVQGRMDPKHERVHIGFATSHPQGGLSGKYALAKGVAVTPDESGQFSLDLAIDMFVPMKDEASASPIGQEVVYLWLQTVEIDAGLVIEGVRWAE